MTTLLDKIENNKLFKFIKENFSLIIFIPSLLGGLRQFIILLIYSPTLIQYFSFTQIAVDGLEIIFQVIIIILIAIFFYKVLFRKIKNFYSKKFLVLLALVLYAGTLIYINGFQIIETDYNLSTFKSFFLKLLTLGLLSFLIADYYDDDYNKKLYADKSKKFMQYFIAFVILYSLYYISALRPFQYNVENVKKQTSIVRKDFGENSELVFYNDSYLIFVLNPDAQIDDRKFYVQKFETLFEDKEEKKTNK